MKAPPFEPASPAERAALAPAIGDPRTWPAASWPDPQPLPEGLAPVAPFDYAMLPDRLRPQRPSNPANPAGMRPSAIRPRMSTRTPPTLTTTAALAFLPLRAW